MNADGVGKDCDDETTSFIVPLIHQLAAGRWGKVKIGFRGVTPVKRAETAKSAKRADLKSRPTFIQSQW